MAPDTDPVHVKLNSDSDSLSQFDQDFSDPQRRALVKVLEYNILLPPISEKRTKKFQSSREAAANSLAITQALLSLFSRLGTWNSAPDQGEGNGIKLVTHIEPSHQAPFPEDDYLHAGDPVWLYRNDLKYLRLDDGLLTSASLPEVRIVSDMHVGTGDYRLHPSVYAALNRALPSVRRLDFALEMPTRRHMFQRREIRSALADALRDATRANLEVLRIQLNDSAPSDERFKLDVLTDSLEEDDLSLAVQSVLKIPSLREASFLGGWILAPSAFHLDTGTSFGSRLELLNFEILPVTPDGKWLSAGNIEDAAENDDRPSSEESLAALDSQDSDTTDYIPDHSWDLEDGQYPECYFRYTFDGQTFDPLLASVAQGVLGMPALRRLHMVTYQSVPFELDYFASGVKNEPVYLVKGPLRRRQELDLEFDETNIQRPRWVMLMVGSGFEFDGKWAFTPKVVNAMEQGDRRVLFIGGSKRLVSSGDGTTLAEVS